MAKSNDIRVVLIASGRTAWDEAGRVGGACDLPLTEAGAAQVRGTLAGLAETRLATVISAPDESSVQTAALVAASVSPVPAPKMRRVDELADVCMGLWEGLRNEEIHDKFPKAFRQWRDDPQAVVIPEGEMLEEAQNRLVQAFSSGLGRVNGDGAAAVVVRPMAHAVIRCWIESAPLRSVWSMLNEAQDLRWETISRDRLRRRPPVRLRV